ncbi:hypothetical protein F6X53_05095 [Methylobacterium soli]|uniref:3',5'-cyclic-nucleotide phosphodiesterase n=2 Tax=Methylobacterium soli TaxID=553447 RepID=A0A6L3T2J9_9HYPH|nr:hypothetical protein F6X53_05095 [Methylobacterium soli]
MQSAYSLTVIALLAATTITPAQARDPVRPTDRLQTFCTADYVRLCPDIDPHAPEMEACFRKNIDDVSPGCRAAVAEYKSTTANGSRAASPER